MLKPGDLHWRCGWLQVQLCAALYWYDSDCLSSFHILNLTFLSLIFLCFFFNLYTGCPLAKYKDMENVLPRSCSVHSSVTALPFSSPHKLIACVVILACWVYASAADNTMGMCLQRSQHSFLSLYYLTKQTGSFAAYWTEIMSISKTFFFDGKIHIALELE